MINVKLTGQDRLTKKLTWPNICRRGNCSLRQHLCPIRLGWALSLNVSWAYSPPPSCHPMIQRQGKILRIQTRSYFFQMLEISARGQASIDPPCFFQQLCAATTIAAIKLSFNQLRNCYFIEQSWRLIRKRKMRSNDVKKYLLLKTDS